MQAPATAPPPPKANATKDRAHKPKQHVDKVNPHGILHPRNTTISFRILFDVHRSKETKDSGPEYEQDNVPAKEDRSREGANN